MKFRFDDTLKYQKDAVEAIAGVFDTGANAARAERGFALRAPDAVVGNELELDEARILKNVQGIQEANKIKPRSENLGSLDFSVEMETGTGKTYVYLRTILELHQRYGLTKFIILVPSVAIREGVLKTLEQTREHFKELFNTGYGYFVYDSGKLSEVREFAQSLDVQIMIMTIQSFNTETNIMRQTDRDDTYGERSYSALVAKTRPVVIMDEPQNMESELARAAIGELRPLFKLRYSATHKELHNLMCRLTPVEAYRKRLVKKIQVYGIRDDNAGTFLFRVKEIQARRGGSPRATVVAEIKNAAGEYHASEVLLRAGDDLFRKTGNEKYNGLIVNDVNAAYNRVELSNGEHYRLDAEIENREEIFRTQIRETITAHLDKQKGLAGRVKVLSLFFIDRVDNYVHEESFIRAIFTEEFERIKRNYGAFRDILASAVHKGYFASRKVRGVVEFQDTRGDSKLDKEAYDLIMRDKERLLSFEEPVCFIFSHSALKEGWDNPNIFQICTLRETHSVMKKRQEIGRGLRLPLDSSGRRVFDSDINVLTVVANESYQEYAAALQREFNEAGYAEAYEPEDARQKPIVVRPNKKNLGTEDFKELWKRINARTRYNIELKTERLIAKTVEELNKRDVANLVVTVDKVSVVFGERGEVKTVYGSQSAGARLTEEIRIGDVVERIARETGVTRRTAFDILSRVNNVALIFENPEEYVRSVIVVVRSVLNDLLINEGLKYIPTGDAWEARLTFTDFKILKSRRIKGGEKSLYSVVVCDSKGETEFAQSLIGSDNIKLFTKLPKGFAVDTPLGPYHPDWAIVYTPNPNRQGGEKLYLVRETKFEYDNLERELPFVEYAKIKCAEKHFAVIGADFKVAQERDLSDLV